MQSPPDAFKDEVDDLETVDQNLLIELSSKLPIRRVNGAIGYLLMSWYPREYYKTDLYKAYINMRDEYTFSDIFSFDGPLLILTMEVGVNHSSEYSKENAAKCGQQIVNNRVSSGIPTWIVRQRTTDPLIDDTLDKNGFNKVTVTSRSPSASDDSSGGSSTGSPINPV